MRNDQFMSAMTDMDDDILLEAAPGACDMAALKKSRRLRSVKTLVIVLCAVAVFGGAAYATDLFGIRFSSEPKEGTMTIRDNEGKNGAYKTYSLEVCAPAVDKKLINGNVQDELDAIKEYIDTNKKDPTPKYVTGITPEEATEYVGYQYLEPVWLPNEKCNTVIRVDNNSICIYAYNEDCGTRDDWLMLHSRVFFTISDQGSSGYMGFMWTEDDDHYVINSKNGCECHIVEYRFITGGEAPFQKICGYTIKNDLIYNIDVIYSENNHAEAQRIVREWAEHF